MDDKVFDINHDRLVRWLLAPALRKPLMIRWLTGLIAPVVSLYLEFKRYKEAKDYQLLITPQICYLERMLNDRFDNTDRRIYIEDTIWFDPWYAYQEDELKPKYMYTEGENKPVYTYTDSEAGLTPDDFVVYVPASLVFNEPEMKALLNIYKLAGTHYKIERF